MKQITKPAYSPYKWFYAWFTEKMASFPADMPDSVWNMNVSELIYHRIYDISKTGYQTPT